jgi:dienelactone hydrolase
MFDYFDSYTFNMAVNTLVEEIGTISEPEAAFRKVAAVEKSGLAAMQAAWFNAMNELGERLESRADADSAQGRPFSAARKYHRASMYFMRAERMVSHRDPQRLQAYKRSLMNYRRARELGRDPIEFVQIPYKSGFMPALFLKGEGEGRRPIVIHLQGFDSVKETQYPYLDGYRRRGVSALIVDQPGTGEALRLHGLTGEVETENYVKVLVDYLENRPDVNSNYIGLAGISMGGYHAPRAACFESRIKACAAWGAMYEMGTLVRSRLEAKSSPSNASLPNPQEHGMWAWGVGSIDEFANLMDRITLRGTIGRLKAPFLVMHGENDRQVPLEQARKTFEEAGSDKKELKIFTVREGGVEHCQLDNRYLGSDYIADWFSEQFGSTHGQAAKVL